MDLPHFAVVDVETSGMSARRHRILQLAVVRVDAHGAVSERWATYVRLPHPFARVGPTHIHGITRPMLRDAPALHEALEPLGEMLQGAVFTAHNASFDAEFIARAARRRSGTNVQLQQRLCTLRLSRRLDPDRQLSHRLADVCERYGVPLTNAHDALADAEATAAVLPHLLRAHHVTATEQLEAFYERRPLQARRRAVLSRL